MPLRLLLLLVSLVCADSLTVHIPGWQSAGAFWRPSGKNVRKAPVIVWLHGGMQSANCAKGLTAGLALRDTALGVNAWVASPSACGEHHWVAAGPALVDALLDSLAARRGFPVDSVRLMGVSDGGLGVVAYSLQGRRRVTHRVLVSTFPGLLVDAEELARQPRVSAGQWHFLQGGADRLFPAERTFPWMQNFCSKLGTTACRVQSDSQGEHDWSWWRAHRLAWLREALR